MKATAPLNTLVLATSLALAGSAQASSIIYDNLSGPSNGADTTSSFGPLYDSFTSPATAQYITGLTLALDGSNGPGTLSIGLYADAGATPGALLVSLGTIDDTTIGPGVNDYTVALVNNPLLAANTRYWIGLTDTDSSNWSWSLAIGGVGVAGEYFSNSNGTFPSSDGPYMMQLEVSDSLPNPVPEAGSTAAALVVAGFAGLAVLRRRLA